MMGYFDAVAVTSLNSINTLLKMENWDSGSPSLQKNGITNEAREVISARLQPDTIV